MRAWYWFSALSIATLGCGGEPGPGGGDLEAIFRGEPLTLASGVASADYPDRVSGEPGDGLWIRFTDEMVDCRNDQPSLPFDQHLVRVELPTREAGTHSNAMVWVQSGTSGMGGPATVVLDIQESEVSGTVSYRSDDGDALVSGSFRVPRCF